VASDLAEERSEDLVRRMLNPAGCEHLFRIALTVLGAAHIAEAPGLKR